MRGGQRSQSLRISRAAGWHRHRKDDDAKIRASREPMTVLQLKRSMDARFRSVDRRFNRRFDRLERELRERDERLRRHFDVVVESLHDDLRMFAEAIGAHSERLGDHEQRLRKLERLT
jgi:hypothetical protein